MNKLKQTGIAAALAFVSGGSLAADLPSTGSPVAPAPIFVQNSWTGFYVGASANYLNGRVPLKDCVGLCENNHALSKFYLAVNAGYDYQFANNLVAGVFGWAAVTPIHETVTLAPGIDVKGRLDFAGFLGARLGYAMGNLMPYVFAGVEMVSGKVTIAVAPNPVNRKTHTGFGLGLGAEYRLTSNWSLDARYMYSELGYERYDFGGGATRGGYKGHTLSLGVNYRFGGPATAIVAKY